MLDHLDLAASDATVNEAALAQEKLSQTEDGCEKNMKENSPSGNSLEADRCNLMDICESSPPLLSTSPHSSLAEEREAEFVRHFAPTSSAIDLQWSSRLGISSHRVGQTRRL